VENEVVVVTGSGADALARLDVLVGDWLMEVRLPGQQEPLAPIPRPAPGQIAGPVAHSWFEWTLEGHFLVQRTEIPVLEILDALMIIAVNPGTDAYTVHYYSASGAAQLYAMTFGGGVWTLTRETADFMPLDVAQRFTGTFSEDGNTINGVWEKRDEGGDWELDFSLTYRRAKLTALGNLSP
jgi:hypothetical protein